MADVFKSDVEIEGLLKVGDTTSPPITGTGVDFIKEGQSNSLSVWSAGTGLASFLTFLKTNGTFASPLKVLINDVLGRIRARGYYDGSPGNYTSTRAEVRMVATENWDDSSHNGAGLEFYGTPNASSTMAILAYLNSLGLSLSVPLYASNLSPAESNFLNNNGFQLFRRQAHTSPATLTSYSNDTYSFDRWYCLTQTSSVQFGQTAGDNSRYSCQIKQNQASAQRFGLAQIIPAGKSISLRGQNVTFQIRAKSSSTPALRLAILEWTGAADAVTSDVINSWTNGTYTAGQFFKSTSMVVTAVSATQNTSGSFSDFSVNGTISSSCNNVIVLVWSENTVAQNVTVDITKTGLFVSNIIQTWQERELSREISDCQFYFRSWADISQPARLPFGSAISGTQTVVGLTFPMRTQPTISISGTIVMFSTAMSTTTNVLSVSVNATDETYQSFTLTFVTAALSMMAGSTYFPFCNSSNSYVWLDCEL